jgi:hypothetical protein
MRLVLVALLVAQLTLASAAAAQEFLFTWTIRVDDGSGSPVSNLALTNDVRSLGDQISPENLGNLFPGKSFVDPTQIDLQASLNLRGVPLDVDFSGANETFVVTADFLAGELHFDGLPLDEAAEAFEDWLTGQVPDTVSTAADAQLTQLLQELVALSAVDPIAGNPNSLQSRMFEAAYSTGTTGVYRGERGGRGLGGQGPLSCTRSLRLLQSGPLVGKRLGGGRRPSVQSA